ncbi:MAG: VOC family protein [Anaerolineales bacterium]|nr:VOC family protein [Anaerolineales bacterium]
MTNYVKGPDFIVLQVRDMEESRRFYTEIIGLAVAPSSPPEAIVFMITPVPFAIRKPFVDLDAVTQLGHGVAIWFRVEDSATLHLHMKNCNVPIVRELTDSPFGQTFTFRDPDGYLITVHDRG